jgi:1-acyl-sn-glycerol-3-phosphate acyltransferase
MTGPMRTWFFGPGSLIVRLGMRLLGPMRVVGLEHVPRGGPFIAVSNHVSNLDPLVLGATVGDLTHQVVYFMAKDEMRRWPLIGWLGTQSGVFYVRRGTGDRAAQRMALDLLLSGKPIAVFPEGHRSRNGALRPGREGAALLALRTGAPILPVGIAGTHLIFRSSLRLPRRSRVTVRIGTAFELPRQAQGRLDRAELTAATDRIMREIAALLPEEQRGPYGGPAPGR